MGRPYSLDLRERVVAAVDKGGMSRRRAAAHFDVGHQHGDYLDAEAAGLGAARHGPAHSHPGGDPTRSRADIEMARVIVGREATRHPSARSHHRWPKCRDPPCSPPARPSDIHLGRDAGDDQCDPRPKSLQRLLSLTEQWFECLLIWKLVYNFQNKEHSGGHHGSLRQFNTDRSAVELRGGFSRPSGTPRHA